ncbi:MAG: Lrp/AsnC family transcriptional regulator [Candidatus Woesearchaeota archaeon]
MKTLVDDKDKKILDLLISNSSMTSKELSKALRMPITTVHHRIKRLKQQGIIKNFTITIDYEKLGYAINAYILAEVDYDQLKKEKITQHELVERLSKYPEIVFAEIVTGETDIILKLRMKSIAELDEFIVRILRNIQGIAKTKTLVVLHHS